MLSNRSHHSPTARMKRVATTLLLTAASTLRPPPAVKGIDIAVTLGSRVRTCVLVTTVVTTLSGRRGTGGIRYMANRGGGVDDSYIAV